MITKKTALDQMRELVQLTMKHDSRYLDYMEDLEEYFDIVPLKGEIVESLKLKKHELKDNLTIKDYKYILKTFSSEWLHVFYLDNHNKLIWKSFSPVDFDEYINLKIAIELSNREVL